ncbi:retrovirus-related pol polyprotein from transposon TNT 1-94 [Tanacetum coccineum]
MKKVQILLSMTDGEERKHFLDYTHVDLYYVGDQMKNLLRESFNSLTKRCPMKNEINDLKNVIEKWTSSKVTLDQLLTEQVPAVFEELKKFPDKKSAIKALKKKTQTMSPSVLYPIPFKKANSSTEQLLLTLMEEKKSDATDCTMSFIRKMENLNEVRVKELRIDNRTEFRNHKLEEFCDEKGISHLPAPLNKMFWGEAVNSACYIQNRYIIVKRHGKTSYEVFRGRSPHISYFHMFGCHVHIHNHRYHLGKFDAKADDGFFLGYSLVAKPIWVFNIRRQEMEETFVTYSEDDEAISKSSTEGDEINFNENRSFPDDEFLVPRSKVSQSSSKDDYFPYVPAYDSLSTNNITIPDHITPNPLNINSPDDSHVFTIADDHHVHNADNFELAEVQDTVINEPILEAKPSPTIISPSAEVVIGQERNTLIKQEEGIDYDETFAPVTRLKAIMIFLAYAAYMGFMIYVDDIIFGSTNDKLSKQFAKLMTKKYEMNLLKKYDLADSTSVKCPMLSLNNLGPDESRVFVNETLYQANPKESYLVAVKRIFMYLKGTPNLGLWYLKGSGFDLKAYSDQTILDVTWTERIKSQLADYDILYENMPIFCDYTSAIAISNNPVLHSRTKHIDIRYHFIRDHISKGDIELHFIPTNMQLADIFTKPLAETSFTRLVAELVEVDVATKSISFTLSGFDKPLSFTSNEFYSIIGLNYSENYVPIPSKETVRTALATLGLVDENDTSISSINLVNSSLLKMRYFSPFWRVLMLYIVKCLGGMSAEWDVNVDDIADKSLSGTNVQPVTQPKAKTNKKSRKKKNPSSSKPETLKIIRESFASSQVTDTQPVKDPGATADAT